MAAAQTFVVKIAVLGLNVATGVLTARALGPSGRAEQAAIQIGVGLLPALLSFGLPVAIQYRLRSDPARQEQFVSVATTLSIAFGVVAAVLSIFILPHVVTRYPAPIVRASELVMVVAPLAILYQVFCAVLQARGQFGEANFTRYAIPLSTLVALVGLLLAHRVTPLTSALAYIAPLLWIVPWLWVRVRPKRTLSGVRDIAGSLLHYGLRSYVIDILGTLIAQIDQVLVIGLLSPFSMGLYAVALSAARSADLFSQPIVLVLFPRASALPPAQIVDMTLRVTRIAIALLFVTTLLIVAAMPILLPAFYGRAYLASVPVAQIIVVSITLSGAGYVFAQAYMAAGRPGVIALINVFGLATVVPALVFLIPRFGLVGAAWALVISTCVRLLTSLCCFPLIFKVPIPSLILTRADVRYLKASLRHHLPESASLPT